MTNTINYKIMKTNNRIKRYKPTHNIPVAAQLP